MSKPHKMIAQRPVPPAKMKAPPIPAENSWKTETKPSLPRATPTRAMKTRASLKYFVSYRLWKTFFNSNSPQTPFKLNSIDIFGNSKAFHTVFILFQDVF